MILFMYKETYFNTNELDSCIPSICVSLLNDYKVVLPIDDVPIIDSRMNPFEERSDYVNQRALSNDPFEILIGSITSSKTKKIQDEFIRLYLG